MLTCASAIRTGEELWEKVVWWDNQVKEGQGPCAQGYQEVQKMDPRCCRPQVKLRATDL